MEQIWGSHAPWSEPPRLGTHSALQQLSVVSRLLLPINQSWHEHETCPPSRTTAWTSSQGCSRSMDQMIPQPGPGTFPSTSMVYSLGSATAPVGSLQTAWSPSHSPDQLNPNLWSLVLGSLSLCGPSTRTKSECPDAGLLGHVSEQNFLGDPDVSSPGKNHCQSGNKSAVILKKVTTRPVLCHRALGQQWEDGSERNHRKAMNSSVKR